MYLCSTGSVLVLQTWPWITCDPRCVVKCETICFVFRMSFEEGNADWSRFVYG